MEIRFFCLWTYRKNVRFHFSEWSRGTLVSIEIRILIFQYMINIFVWINLRNTVLRKIILLTIVDFIFCIMPSYISNFSFFQIQRNRTKCSRYHHYSSEEKSEFIHHVFIAENYFQYPRDIVQKRKLVSDITLFLKRRS